MFSRMNGMYYNNHINHFKDDQPTLNTPPIEDVYNTEKEKKDSGFDWTFDSPALIPHEIRSTPAISENEISISTNMTNSSSESSLISHDRFVQYSVQVTSPIQSEMIPFVDMNEVEESAPTLDEFLQRGIDHDINLDPIAQETTEEHVSNLFDTPTTVNENSREPMETSSMNDLHTSSSSDQPTQTIPDTGIRLSSRMISDGCLRHPILLEDRARYETDFTGNKLISAMCWLKDVFSNRPILIGPRNLFGNGSIEVALLATTPDGEIMFSPHTFYCPNQPKEKTFSNPIYLQPEQFNIENDYIKLNLQIAHKLQNDFLLPSHNRWHWDKTCPRIIKHYLTGEEKPIHMSPRKLNKNYQLDISFIGIRRAELQSDGISYLIDRNSPIIYSNRFARGIPILKSVFLGHLSSPVPSKNSATTWDVNGSKLRILDTKIINRTVSTGPNNICELEFIVLVPELYHCSLKSGSKQLEIKLITENDISRIYTIAFEGNIGNILYLPVNHSCIDVQLMIVKNTSPDQDRAQNGVWLELFTTQAKSTGFDHFHVDICLQDVDTTGPRSYPYSNVNSVEFIDMTMLTSTQPMSFPANDQLQHNDHVVHDMVDTRRHDDGNESIGDALSITRIPTKTGE